MRAKWSAPIRKYWKVSEQMILLRIVNGCKVKITYAEDGDSMEVLQKLIHDTLREEAKNYS